MTDHSTIGEFLSENGYYNRPVEQLREHSHGTLRTLSSFINWKLATGKYGGRHQTTTDHASRFHELHRYYIPNLEMIRYMYSQEDWDYLKKHGGKLNEDLQGTIELKNGTIEPLEEYRNHIFTDCHYYEKIEEAIIRGAMDGREIFCSGIQPDDELEYEEDTTEYKL